METFKNKKKEEKIQTNYNIYLCILKTNYFCFYRYKEDRRKQLAAQESIQPNYMITTS